MKKQVLCVFLLATCSVVCSASAPKWLLDAERAFPSEKYIRAIGEGKSVENAKKNALAELGAYFSQTVSSEINAVQRLSKSEGFLQKEQLTRSVNTSSLAKLFAVHYTDFYHDKSQKSYSICAYIVRDEAWSIVSKRLSVVQSAFKNGIALAESESEPFKKVLAMNRAFSLEEEFFELYEMALVVYPKKCGDYTKTAENIEREKQNAARLKKDVSVSVSVNGDFSAQIKTKIESLLSQNGFTVFQNGSYKLNATVWARIHESGGVYSCTPRLDVVIQGKNGAVASFADEVEKFSAYNAQTAEKVSLSNLEAILDEKFVRECLQ